MAHAQNNEPVFDPAIEPFAAFKVGKVLEAFPLTGVPPDVDGRLDEAVWQQADALDDLVQWEPDNMAPMTERTVVRVVHDDRYLYVGVYCYDSDPSAIRDGLGRRDNFPATDKVNIAFDPQHDHQTAYVFKTNPSGLQEDERRFNDTSRDISYDAVWEVNARIVSDGWTAEFRIPFSQMRFRLEPGRRTVWGFSVRREINRKGEEGEWIGRPRGETGNVSWWGHLVFEPDAFAPPRRIELLPYVLGGATRFAGSSETDARGGTGLDLRYGIGSSATLSATFNPDFGQVEQDPAVLNLTVFETFFPERRPFFLEDSRNFTQATERFRLFHSRRIGRSPGLLPVDADETVLDRPDETTILGAAKLTGQTGTWTYGALTALTDQEFATIEGDVGDIEQVIEPMTSYSVARLQRDVGEASNIGGIVTATVRDQAADAFTGGFDHTLRWDRNRWRWVGVYAVSRAPEAGNTAAGFGGNGVFGFAGKYVSASTNYSHLGRDFRINDLGFLRGRVDETEVSLRMSAGQPDPWSIFRSIRVLPRIGGSWNGDGLQLQRTAGVGVTAVFRNFWRANVFATRFGPHEDDLDTRGGPPIVRLGSRFYSAGITTDSRKTWRIGLNVGGESFDDGGWTLLGGPDITLQPSPRLQIGIGAQYRFGDTVAQWIANEDVTGNGDVDHVYGRLRLDTVDVTLRTTLAIHRDLSFQAFLQPFVAVGDYNDIRRLAAPRTFTFEPVALSYDPDFNRKSLRGNLVLRWEYLRASTLFLVWNMSTFDPARGGLFDPWRDLGDTFSAPGTHAFLLKLSYWWSP